MKLIAKIFDAIHHIATFKSYTTMPRWMEIGYGILFYIEILTIIVAIFKILK